MRTTVMLLVMASVLVSGCGGVWMDAAHSLTLDRAVKVSDEAVARLATNPVDKAEFARLMVVADNKYLHSMQDARDGKAKAATP